nr:uncharacterized protein LOC120973986 [Aegilops tauschii subsp. strangulata]
MWTLLNSQDHMRFQESWIPLGTRQTVLKVLKGVPLQAEMPGKNCLLYRCKNKDEFAASMPSFDEWGLRPIGLVGPRENPIVVAPFFAAGAGLAPCEVAGERAPTGAGRSSPEEHMPNGDPGASSSGACDPPPETPIIEEVQHVAPKAKALGSSGGCGETQVEVRRAALALLRGTPTEDEEVWKRGDTLALEAVERSLKLERLEMREHQVAQAEDAIRAREAGVEEEVNRRVAEVRADLEGRYDLKLKLTGTEDAGRAAALRPRLDEAERCAEATAAALNADNHLTLAGLTLEMIGADFIRHRIALLHNKGRPASDFRNAADIMRLRPSLKHNFTVLGHAHFCQRLFQLKVNEDDRVERTGKAVKAGGAGYIAARAEEEALAREAGSIGAMEDEADTAVEEKELAEWAGSAREASSAGAGAPLVEDVVEESTEEEAEADDSSPPARRRVLRRASSGEPVRPGRTAQRQQAQVQPMRQTRATAAKKKAAAAASSSPKRRRTPSPSPPPSDSEPDADFDLGSFIPKRKRRPAEEEEETETLAQRAAQRAKASAGDKPPASTSRMPETPHSMDQEDINIVIGEVAKDAKAEAVRIAAKEIAKSATGEAGKGTTDTRAPAEGEIFDDEALATAGLQVVNEPSASSGGPQEEHLLRAMGANFQKLQALHRACQDKALAATLRDKDEEIGEIVAQRTQELEQRHKEALDAQALVHAGKVKELELEREELKKKVSALTEERDTANRTLADAQVAISDKAKLLSKANDSINNLKLKLDGLEGKLSEAGAREDTLNKALEDEKWLRRDDAAEHKEYTKSVNLWISRLVDVASRITTKLAAMGMSNVRYSQEPNVM